MPQDQNYIDIQNACSTSLPFKEDCLENWVHLTFETMQLESSELTLRFVEASEITSLNKTYRKKDKPTNVLAFPSSIPENIPLEVAFLGDIIVCPSVLEAEALEQNKPLEAHWAHIIIHGVLHLLGYDHIEEKDAKIMQDLEVKILSRLHFENPYHPEF